MIDGRWLEIYMFYFLQRLYDIYHGSIMMFDFINMVCDVAGISEVPINNTIRSLREGYEQFVPTIQELVYYDQKYGKEYYNLRGFLGITAQIVCNNKFEDFNPRNSKLDEETLDALNVFVITLNKIGGTMLCKKNK